jgi:hypothetical protein
MRLDAGKRWPTRRNALELSRIDILTPADCTLNKDIIQRATGKLTEFLKTRAGCATPLSRNRIMRDVPNGQIAFRLHNRHCEEHLRRLVRRSSTSEGGSNPSIRYAALWIASLTLAMTWRGSRLKAMGFRKRSTHPTDCNPARRANHF